jgi:hypothetical protein
MRRRGLGRTMARTAVIAGTATAVSGHVARRQDARQMQQAQPVEQPAQQPPPAPVDVAGELKKFAALRDQGILTEEEFAVQKARLLSQ